MAEAPRRASTDTDLARLLREAQRGSTEALAQLLEACRPYLLDVANQELDSDLRAKFGASDLVQETLVKVREAYAGFRGQQPREVLGWMRQILLNHLANLRRHYQGTRKRQAARELPLDRAPPDLLECLADPNPTPARQVTAQEERRRLEQALERLPERYQQVIRLRQVQGESFAEIGAKLHCSAGAARKLWIRALVQLEKALGPPDSSLSH